MKGFVAWSITDTKSEKEIGHGRRDLGPSDLTIRDIPNPKTPMQMLEIELTPPFLMGFARVAYPPPQRTTGFGFSACRKDMRSFSWEWFQVKSPHEALTIQEKGLLGIEMVGEEVVKTEFLTDVSLRVSDMLNLLHVFSPQWRIKILEGSWMRWPLRGS